MAQVKVTSTIKHDGTIFEAGEVLGGLTDAQAKALVEAGAAEFGRGDEPASKGRKQGARSSKVKESLLGADGKAKGGAKKSVAEKAQERAQGGEDAKEGNDTPPADENAAGSQDAGDSSNTGDGNDAGDEGDGQQDGAGQGDGDTKTEVADAFEFNGAKFTTKLVGKNKQKHYYKDGKEIKKVDYLTAYQEAQG